MDMGAKMLGYTLYVHSGAAAKMFQFSFTVITCFSHIFFFFFFLFFFFPFSFFLFFLFSFLPPPSECRPGRIAPSAPPSVRYWALRNIRPTPRPPTPVTKCHTWSTHRERYVIAERPLTFFRSPHFSFRSGFWSHNCPDWMTWYYLIHHCTPTRAWRTCTRCDLIG